jgi:hypothetical protein
VDFGDEILQARRCGLDISWSIGFGFVPVPGQKTDRGCSRGLQTAGEHVYGADEEAFDSTITVSQTPSRGRHAFCGKADGRRREISLPRAAIRHRRHLRW